MQEIIKILIGILIVILGFPIGLFLKSVTKDELKKGQIWFKIITLLGLMGAVISIIFEEDVFFFTSLFISAVTSRSITLKKIKKTSKKNNKRDHKKNNKRDHKKNNKRDHKKNNKKVKKQKKR